MKEKKYKFIVNKKKVKKEILNKERKIAKKLRKQKLSLREISEIIGKSHEWVRKNTKEINDKQECEYKILEN